MLAPLQRLMLTVGGSVLLLALGVWWWKAHEAATYQRGYQAAVAERLAADAAHLKQDAARALADERTAAATRDAEQAKRLERDKKYESTIAGLRADVAAGRRRLHFGANAGLPADAAATNAGAGAGPGAEGGANVVPETGLAILDIGAGITRLVRRHNALIDEYETLRKACNN